MKCRQGDEHGRGFLFETAAIYPSREIGGRLELSCKGRNYRFLRVVGVVLVLTPTPSGRGLQHGGNYCAQSHGIVIVVGSSEEPGL